MTNSKVKLVRWLLALFVVAGLALMALVPAAGAPPDDEAVDAAGTLDDSNMVDADALLSSHQDEGTPELLAPQTAKLFGITPRGEWGNVIARNLAVAAGAKWARMSISWAQTQPIPNTYKFSTPDTEFSRLQSLGLIPIVLIFDNPTWAAASNCGPPYNLSSLVNFIAKVAERYDGDRDYDGNGTPDGPEMPRIDYWQLYNEPDIRWKSGIAATFGGCWAATAADAQQYATLLVLAWQKIHTANPNGQLVFGSIAGENVLCDASWGRNEPCNNPVPQDIFDFNYAGGDFVDKVFNYLKTNFGTAYGFPFFDVFDFHYYPGFHCRNDPRDFVRYCWDNTGLGVAGKAEYYRARMVSRLGATAASKVGMMCTEAGRRSDASQVVDGVQGSHVEQSTYVVRFFTQGLKANLRALTWFTLADLNIPSQGGLKSWGLLTEGGWTIKPSYNAYKTLTQQLGTASYMAQLNWAKDRMEGYQFKLANGAVRSAVWLTATTMAQTEVTYLTKVITTTNAWGVTSVITDGLTGDLDKTANGMVTIPITRLAVYIDRPLPAPLTRNINAGGPKYTDTAAKAWAADRKFAASAGYGYTGTTSSVISTTREIAGTNDDPMYRLQRLNPGSYRFSVPNGTYTVILHFAEIQYTAAGQRKFDIKIQGANSALNFDIFVAAGNARDKAVIRTFSGIRVTNRLLTVQLVPRVGLPALAGIQIIQH